MGLWDQINTPAARKIASSLEKKKMETAKKMKDFHKKNPEYSKSGQKHEFDHKASAKIAKVTGHVRESEKEWY